MCFLAVWREARHGLRSMRVGEALHPGPASESDTESLDDGASDAGVAEEVGPVEAVPVPFETPQREAIVRGFASLDMFELTNIFRCRAAVMRSVPCILRGAFRSVLRIAMEEAVAGQEVFDEVRQDRAWKLFLLLPRMLLHRPARGGLVPKAKLIERFAKFGRGEWADLVEESIRSAEAGSQAAIRKRRRQEDDDLARRVARAERLARLGELSSARQALESAAVAPGSLRTLHELTNPERRPAVPRSLLDPELDDFEPGEQINLDPELLTKTLRTARRGAAAGPSGMTAEHLRPLLEGDREMAVFHQFAHIMARGEVPDRIEGAVRMGRITALRKPDGGVRGIVVGDFLRRLGARTIAKQIAKQVEVATAPWQHALTTRAGCESASHTSCNI